MTEHTLPPFEGDYLKFLHAVVEAGRQEGRVLSDQDLAACLKQVVRLQDWEYSMAVSTYWEELARAKRLGRTFP